MTPPAIPPVRSLGKTPSVLVLAAAGGNITQELSNLNVLYKFRGSQYFSRLMMLSTENLLFLLEPSTEHVIHCAPGTKVGLIPLGHKCEGVNTRGLRWDLRGNELQFGGLVSSSNEITRDQSRQPVGQATVHITGCHPLLFVVDFRD